MKKKHHPRRLLKKYFSAFVKRHDCLESSGNKVKLYFHGDDLYADMLEAISQAKEFIHFEIYNIASDKIGEKIANALIERAAQGVKVRLVYDAVGCLDSQDEFYVKMAKKKLDVLPFRPLAPWRKRRGLLGRNHRKNLIIDGRVAFAGGMNVCALFSKHESGPEAWRDTHVRLTGPAAQACNHFFLETWEYVGGDKPEKAHLPERDNGFAEQKNSACLVVNETNEESKAEASTPSDEGDEMGDCDCMVVGGRGSSKRKTIREFYIMNLQKAEKRVELSIPYFVPPQRLLKCLLATARRGVQVDLLVPEKSDIRFADWIRDGLYPILLKKGVRIHEYTPSMLHAKTMVIDDEFSVVGSANFDNLSLALNWELTILIENDHVTEAMHRQFGKDLAQSRLIPPDWSGKLPFYQRVLARTAAFLNRKL